MPIHLISDANKPPSAVSLTYMYFPLSETEFPPQICICVSSVRFRRFSTDLSHWTMITQHTYMLTIYHCSLIGFCVSVETHLSFSILLYLLFLIL
jgi:hypothetical protein